MTFTELAIPVQVAIITSVVGAITITLNIWLARRNIKNLEQRRFIDTISAQRIQWLNTIREAFIEYTLLTSKMTTKFRIIKANKSLHEAGLSDGVLDYYTKLEGIIQKISLLTNPSEFLPRKLNSLLDELITSIIADAKQATTSVKSKELKKKIHFIQQVILKAEWKRIIKEIEQGQRLSDEEVDEIFEEVANDINAQMYQKLKEEVSTKEKTVTI